MLAAALAVNLLSAFGPEMGFDALWYHLTIPKLYLAARAVYHIPGGLLYYSEMPRLTEMIFLFLLKFFPAGRETGPHLLGWAAGAGSAGILYLLARKYLEETYSLLAVLIFYVTPLVGWLSGSAYIDLERTFWEILALYLLLNRKIFWSGIALGLAIASKTLALGTAGILLLLGLMVYRDLKKILLLTVTAGVVALPWFVSAYLNTGYPFYPLGADILDKSHRLVFQFPGLITDFVKLAIGSADPISPLFLMLLPFLIIFRKNMPKNSYPLIIYSVLAYLVWWLIPRTGGGRFLLPYLPVWALLSGLVIKNIPDRFLRRLLFAGALVIAVLNLFYRGIATFRLLPVILGRETRTAYLCRNLAKLPGTFYDCSGWFADHIQSTDLAYVSGVHNLYYLDFPFVEESWYRGEKVDYLIVPDGPWSENTETLYRSYRWQEVYRDNRQKLIVYRL